MVSSILWGFCGDWNLQIYSPGEIKKKPTQLVKLGSFTVYFGDLCQIEIFDIDVCKMAFFTSPLALFQRRWGEGAKIGETWYFQKYCCKPTRGPHACQAKHTRIMPRLSARVRSIWRSLWLRHQKLNEHALTGSLIDQSQHLWHTRQVSVPGS